MLESESPSHKLNEGRRMKLSLFICSRRVDVGEFFMSNFPEVDHGWTWQQKNLNFEIVREIVLNVFA